MFQTKNEQLDNYIKVNANLQKIKKIITDNEVNRNAVEVTLANWKKQPNFLERLLNNFPGVR